MEEISMTERHVPITAAQMEMAIDRLLSQYPAARKVLLLPPDYTRCYSMAGELTQILYRKLCGKAKVHIMPTVGTHVAVSPAEQRMMFGDIPDACFLHHRWQNDTVSIGTVPADIVGAISEGLFVTDIDVEVNEIFWNGGYDLILSIGQVVPHEVIGMANYSKNIFVGIGGRQMINKTHMLGAVCGMEQALGKDHSPVRRVLDYAETHFLQEKPVVYLLTVTTEQKGNVALHGLYIGDSRRPYEQAVALSQQLNINYLDRPAKKVVAYLDPLELKTTWVGNKGIYRSRMAIADGGELILLAPGITRFGESDEIDRAIREFGYRGRDYVLELYRQGAFENRLMVAAHLIHGSSDGRFTITYATDPRLLTKAEVEGVGFHHMDFAAALERYDPATMREGFQTLADGEEIYFIRTPAVGLWKLRE